MFLSHATTVSSPVRHSLHSDPSKTLSCFCLEALKWFPLWCPGECQLRQKNPTLMQSFSAFDIYLQKTINTISSYSLTDLKRPQWCHPEDLLTRRVQSPNSAEFPLLAYGGYFTQLLFTLYTWGQRKWRGKRPGWHMHQMFCKLVSSCYCCWFEGKIRNCTLFSGRYQPSLSCWILYNTYNIKLSEAFKPFIVDGAIRSVPFVPQK